MTPLNLAEWLEQVRAAGHAPDADFASEALEIVAHNRTHEANSMERDLQHAAGQKFDDTWRLVEFFTDRHYLLDELVDRLDQAGFKGDPDDALGEVLAELEDLRTFKEATEDATGGVVL